VKLVIQGREYDWPDSPTYRQRRMAARALEISVNELIDVLTDNERTAEREEVFAALALVQAGEDATVVLDMSPGEVTLKVEDTDTMPEAEQLPPGSSRDGEEVAAAA